MKIKIIFCSLIAVCCSCVSRTDGIRGESHRPAVPVLALKTGSPVLQLRLTRQDSTNYLLEKVEISFEGTTDINDVDSVGLFPADESGMPAFRIPLAPMQKADEKVVLHPNYRIDVDTLICWVAVRLKDSIDLTHRIKASCTGIRTDAGKVDITPPANEAAQRVGVALRQHMQDGVHTSRIPGLTTSKKGTLLAIYDARRQSGRDLQGDIDIALNRSADGGRTWSPMQVVLDMGPWGGLPEKYNGVSDACILADDNTGDLYVFGLWMHGVLDSRTGKWVEGLTDTSTVWNHQWRSRGSGPGYGVRQTPQLLVTKSTDDGLTWSTPENITRQVKEAGWWLLAPAPGRGITLADGTLVFPSEGRGETGASFSTITYSKDGGKTWTTANPAYANTNECMAAQLSDGSIMLNMRERGNRGRLEGNGRAIAVTRDLGKTWTEHPTSRSALVEPACMASLYRHDYTENGDKKSVLLFLNPNSKTRRNDITLKVSFDDGNTWPETYWLLLDEYDGAGYSCITSVDEKTVGVLYEGSQADMVYQQIPLNDILHPDAR